jgi:hypothetical protein
MDEKAHDAEAMKKLWEISENMTGVHYLDSVQVTLELINSRIYCLR